MLFMFVLILPGCLKDNVDPKSDLELMDTFLVSEISTLSENTPLINKHKLEFDNAKTFTIWLYADVPPTQNQIDVFGKSLASTLLRKFPDYYFNFMIFPKDSTKEIGDTQSYDTYSNFVWRNDKIVYPME